MVNTDTLPNPIADLPAYRAHLGMIEKKQARRDDDLYQTKPHEDTVRAIDTFAKHGFPYNREIAEWIKKCLGEPENNYDIEHVLLTEVYLAQHVRQDRLKQAEMEKLMAHGYSRDLAEVFDRALAEGKRIEIYLCKETILGKMAEPKVYRPIKMVDGVRAVMPPRSKTKGYRLSTFEQYNLSSSEFALARVEK